MEAILDSLAKTYDPAHLTEVALSWVPRVVAAVFTILLFWFLARVARRLLGGMMQQARMDSTAAAFVQVLVRFALVAVAVLTALSQLGFDTSSVLASLGILGLTLGLAAQTTLSNVIAGLFIFWDRPFVIDDLVEVDGEYGRVSAITLRSTRIVTPDGRMLAIPNAAVANAKVASYTNFPHLRIDVPITVGVDEDIGRIRSLLVAIVDGHEDFMAEPGPSVLIEALNDYNIAIVFTAWIGNERDHIRLRAWLVERALETLRGAGVDMPFETLALAPLTVNQG